MDADQTGGVHGLLVPQFGNHVIQRTIADKSNPAQSARMHVTNRPVRIVAERIDGFDRHQRPFKRAHPVETKRDHQELQDGVFPQLVPSPGEGHQPVDHPTPRRHPQHDREGHAKSLRPIRQRCIVQMVRTRPDIQEDQRPEMDDRQAVGVNRTPRLLGHEIVHHAQKARRQEEADRVMPIPPFDHGALYPPKDRIALGTEEGNRHR